MKRFTKQACRENVVASFFPLKIFIPLCFNVLSTVPRENRLAEFLYIYIYITFFYRVHCSELHTSQELYYALSTHKLLFLANCRGRIVRSFFLFLI